MEIYDGDYIKYEGDFLFTYYGDYYLKIIFDPKGCYIELCRLVYFTDRIFIYVIKFILIRKT